MTLKNFGAYLMLAIILFLFFLFLFKPDIFYRIMDYQGPGSPFVHPPSY